MWLESSLDELIDDLVDELMVCCVSQNLRRQIEEYETKAKQLEEEVRKEEEKQGQAA